MRPLRDFYPQLSATGIDIARAALELAPLQYPVANSQCGGFRETGFAYRFQIGRVGENLDVRGDATFLAECRHLHDVDDRPVRAQLVQCDRQIFWRLVIDLEQNLRYSVSLGCKPR